MNKLTVRRAQQTVDDIVYYFRTSIIFEYHGPSRGVIAIQGGLEDAENINKCVICFRSALHLSTVGTTIYFFLHTLHRAFFSLFWQNSNIKPLISKSMFLLLCFISTYVYPQNIKNLTWS